MPNILSHSNYPDDYFQHDEYAVNPDQPYKFATKDDIENFDTNPLYQEYIDPDNGKTYLTQLDTDGNIIEQPVITSQPNIDPTKRIYHPVDLQNGESQIHMYDTYDHKLHRVKNIDEFIDAVILHYQWLHTKDSDHPQGHQLSLAGDFDWNQIQQLEPDKENNYHDVTVKVIQEKLYNAGILSQYRSTEEIKKDNQHLQELKQTLQKQADHQYYLEHQSQYKDESEVPEGTGQIDPEELALQEKQYFLSKPESRLNLSDSDMEEQDIDQFNLSNINFVNAKLNGSTFHQCQFKNSSFKHNQNLSNTTFADCLFQNTSFAHANLKTTAFLKSVMHQTDFTKTKVSPDTDFTKSWLTDSKGMEFTPQTGIPSPDDPETQLPGLSQTELDKLMYDAHKKGQTPVLSNYNLSRLDFSRYAKLYHNDLSCIDFSGSNLSGCDFTGMRISHCNFSGCNVTNSNFNNTVCIGTSFDQCHGENTAFDYAEMLNTTFLNANLPYSSFDRTTLNQVQFTNTNLSHSVFQHNIGRGTTFQTNPNLAPQSTDKKQNLVSPVNLSDAYFNHSKLHDITISNAVVTNTILVDPDFRGSKSKIIDTPMQDAILSYKDASLIAKQYYDYKKSHNMPTYDTTNVKSNKNPQTQKDSKSSNAQEQSHTLNQVKQNQQQHQQQHQKNRESQKEFHRQTQSKQQEKLKTDIQEIKTNLKQRPKQAAKKVVSSIKDTHNKNVNEIDNLIKQARKANNEKFQNRDQNQSPKL